LVTVKAYVPIIDEEFEVVANLVTDQGNISELKDEFRKGQTKV
jgi:hypothetical protein